MVELSPDESRVLGVLIEKALTTPEQYPLSLNAIVNGANQKNNREPVTAMTEDQAFAAMEGLRAKGLAVRVDQASARVQKYKHAVIETLHVRTGEAAILAELLLRGPQTLGELRGRGSRMAPMETLEAAKELVRALSERGEPLVKQISPQPGSRAERFVQLLCPNLHAVEATASTVASPVPAVAGAPNLADRVAKLEQEVAELRGALQRLSAALGETEPTTSP
jgi:uncharacterized protein YceH (UPF0502 family)